MESISYSKQYKEFIDRSKYEKRTGSPYKKNSCNNKGVKMDKIVDWEKLDNINNPYLKYDLTNNLVNNALTDSKISNENNNNNRCNNKKYLSPSLNLYPIKERDINTNINKKSNSSIPTDSFNITKEQMNYLEKKSNYSYNKKYKNISNNNNNQLYFSIQDKETIKNKIDSMILKQRDILKRNKNKNKSQSKSNLTINYTSNNRYGNISNSKQIEKNQLPPIINNSNQIKARKIKYKPKSLFQYKKKYLNNEFINLSNLPAGLGSNIGSIEWKNRFDKVNKRKEYSEKIDVQKELEFKEKKRNNKNKSLIINKKNENESIDEVEDIDDIITKEEKNKKYDELIKNENKKYKSKLINENNKGKSLVYSSFKPKVIKYNYNYNGEYAIENNRKDKFIDVFNSLKTKDDTYKNSEIDELIKNHIIYKEKADKIKGILYTHNN